MKLLKQTDGFAHWLILLLIILLLAIGFAGWKVWEQQENPPKAKKSTASSQKSVKNAVTRTASPNNTFSVVLPNNWVQKTCSDSVDLLMLAPNESLLGHCNSESAGMVSISRNDGDQRESEASYEANDYYHDLTFSNVTIDDLPGYKLTYTIGNSGEIGYPPVGTIYQQYFLYDDTDDKTYIISYQQLAASPDHAATFTTIAESFSRE